ncbi:hypothetical protein R1CP_32455 [Rhodococcus opacus]|uniref:Uncharacterized protein n=1 Tax=Rhodococcus opacus TaxID=37919 RepID=A0A1B1KER8_RHOOP|nr:PaaI family thioesterase [Rhodococcus opacus]ANS31114.1 hypothetical protein R1CP_32455 [Rhodococcus opacus]
MLIAKNPEFEQFVKTAVLTMPAAMHLGFHFGHIAAGEVELIQPYRKELTEHNGFFQGGVIGSLADFAGGAAAGTLLPVGWVNMTADYTVKLLAPAEGTTSLHADLSSNPAARSRWPRSTCTRAKHIARPRWSQCVTCRW